MANFQKSGQHSPTNGNIIVLKSNEVDSVVPTPHTATPRPVDVLRQVAERTEEGQEGRTGTRTDRGAPLKAGMERNTKSRTQQTPPLP